MPSNHLILCHPLLLLPSIFPSIKVFSNERVLCIRWPKYWSFSFSISPSNEYSSLISFRMDWLDLLAVQGTLKSLLQHYISKASILWCWAFFIVQLSHPYMTTGKTTALTIQNFVHKVRSLLFNMLSRLVLVKSLSHVRLFATPWIVAYQALRSLSVHGIFQARVLEWVAISFFRGSSQPRDWTPVSRTASRRSNHLFYCIIQKKQSFSWQKKERKFSELGPEKGHL